MIISFRCKETQKIWLGLFSKKFPPTLQHLVLRKLRLIDAAHSIEDLKVPPGNHLELLKGNRAGFVSIRVNAQWRICFRFWQHGAHDVELVDYH